MTSQLRRFGYELGDGEEVDATVTYDCEVIDEWTRNVAALCPSDEKVIVGLALERNTPECPECPPATLQLCVDSSQLCVDSRCLMIHLSHVSNIPISLKSFLANSNVVCVGMVTKDVKEELLSKYGISCAKTIDVRVLCKKYKRGKVPINASLETLAWEILNVKLPERPNSTDWEKPILSDDQMEYACINALACSHIGCMILK